MKRLFTVLMIFILSSPLLYSQNSIIKEVSVLDSSSNSVLLGRQSLVIDHNNVIHLFYVIKGETADSIFGFTSNDNGITWNGPENISTYEHSSSYTREHIRQISATIDDNNNIHIIYEYTGPPNYISGFDDFPSSHVSYITKVDGNWATSENVINDKNIQSSEGNGSTVSYLNSCQIMNYKNSQHFISYDYAWWATKYHVVYSNNISGNWLAGDTLHTFNLGDYDNIILNAPSLMVNNDTLFAVWYQRYDCTIEMKKFDGTTWSNVQTIFKDKYYSHPHPTSYVVKTNICQNNETAVAAMLRSTEDTYNELILLSKNKNANWQIDTTQLPEKYSAVQPAIYGDTTYLYLYKNSTYSGSIVKFTNDGGFTSPVAFGPNDNLKLLYMSSLSDASIPFAYVARNSDNVSYLKIGKINNLITGVKNDNMKLPAKFSLSQNYPNPFNPTTTIEYSIPAVETRHALSVQLKIYDILGREIAALVNEKQQPGNYSVQFNAENLSSGVYFYMLETENFIAVKKMILLK